MAHGGQMPLPQAKSEGQALNAMGISQNILSCKSCFISAASEVLN